MPARMIMIALFALGAALPAAAQGDHTLPIELAAPGKPTLIPKEGASVFGEGVAADWQGNIYSNEMGNADRTMQLKVGADSSKQWRKANDDPNGMWLDTRNRLVICQTRAMVRVKAGASFDNQTDTLYKYASGGSDFNDVTGDSKDNLYFTNFQGRTVYFRNAATGETKPVLNNLNLPNGIEWDEERKVVYVNLNGDGKVVAYKVADDYSLTNGTDFAPVRGADGITLDAQGNVYAVAFGDRVHVINPAGQKQGEIVFTGLTNHQLTNLSFGGADFKTLYMITNKGLYKLPMKVNGYKSGNYSVSLEPSSYFTTAKSQGRRIRFGRSGFMADFQVESRADLNGRVIPMPGMSATGSGTPR